MRAVRRREQRLGTLRRATADDDSMHSQSPHTTSKAKAAQMSTAEFDDMFGPSQSLMQDYSFEEYSVDHSKKGGAGVSKRGQVRKIVNKKHQKQSSKGSQILLERKKRQQQLLRADSASSNSQANRYVLMMLFILDSLLNKYTQVNTYTYAYTHITFAYTHRHT
jgi:hypothetical protein